MEECKKVSIIGEFIRKQSMLTKTAFVGGAIVYGVLAAGKLYSEFSATGHMINFSENTHDAQQMKWERQYGTVENPLFFLKENDSLFPSLDEEYRKRKEEVYEKTRKLNELVQRTLINDEDKQTIIHARDSYAIAKVSKYTLEMAKEIAALDDVNSEAQTEKNRLNELETGLDNIKNAMKTYENNESPRTDILFTELGLNIVNKILTAEFETDLKVKIVNKLSGDKAGYHEFYSDEIVLEDEKTYYINLMHYFHEIGHVIYQGGEAFYVQQEGGNADAVENAEKEALAMEEAAAYLFEIAGAKELEKDYPTLAELIRGAIESQRKEQTKKYSSGSADQNDCGGALAEVLLEHFNGNYTAAFNYLMTKNKIKQLDPEIVKIYGVRALLEPKDFGALDKEFTNKVRTELDNLEKRMIEFSDNYLSLETEPAPYARKTIINIKRISGGEPERKKKDNAGKKETGKDYAGKKEAEKTSPEERQEGTQIEKPQQGIKPEEKKKEPDPCEDSVNTADSFRKMQAGCGDF